MTLLLFSYQKGRYVTIFFLSLYYNKNQTTMLKTEKLEYLGSTGRNMTQISFYYNSETKTYYRDPFPGIDADKPGSFTQEVEIEYVPKRFRKG